MMRLLSQTLLFISVAGLAACASLPTDAPPYSQAPTAPEGYATIYFYRVGAYPTLRKPDVLVSGKRVYEPPELAYTWIHAKAGERQIGVEWASDTKWPRVDVKQAIASGATYYIKISGSFENKGVTSYNTITHILGSSARLVPTKEAEVELANCCKYVKPEFQRLD
jgi:Protein of unknown function (DUF2846)